MNDLFFRIYSIYPNLPVSTLSVPQFIIEDHGDGLGPSITSWLNAVYAEPTTAQLQAVTAAQITAAQNNLEMAQHKTKYNADLIFTGLFLQYQASNPSATMTSYITYLKSKVGTLPQ
jgi:hypothetical protein